MTLHEQAVIEAAQRVVKTQEQRCRKGKPYVAPIISIALLAAALADLEDQP